MVQSEGFLEINAQLVKYFSQTCDRYQQQINDLQNQVDQLSTTVLTLKQKEVAHLTQIEDQLSLIDHLKISLQHEKTAHLIVIEELKTAHQKEIDNLSTSLSNFPLVKSMSREITDGQHQIKILQDQLAKYKVSTEATPKPERKKIVLSQKLKIGGGGGAGGGARPQSPPAISTHLEASVPVQEKPALTPAPVSVPDTPVSVPASVPVSDAPVPTPTPVQVPVSEIPAPIPEPPMPAPVPDVPATITPVQAPVPETPVPDPVTETPVPAPAPVPEPPAQPQ